MSFNMETEGDRVTVRGASFDECQAGVFEAMETFGFGFATFTLPVKDAAGEYVAVGHIYTQNPNTLTR
jgi:hypothetical protein